jgi:hypothetical protein
VLAWSPTNLGITEGNHERLVQALWVSGDLFNVLGVRPAMGRLFGSADDQPGCGMVAEGDGAFETGRFVIYSECGSQIPFTRCF